VELVVAVGADGERVERKRDLGRIGVARELTSRHRGRGLGLEHAQPAAERELYGVMDCAPTRVELDGGGSQKTSAGKGRLADVVDPAVADREQPRAPRGLDGCGLV